MTIKSRLFRDDNFAADERSSIAFEGLDRKIATRNDDQLWRRSSSFQNPFDHNYSQFATEGNKGSSEIFKYVSNASEDYYRAIHSRRSAVTSNVRNLFSRDTARAESSQNKQITNSILSAMPRRIEKVMSGHKSNHGMKSHPSEAGVNLSIESLSNSKPFGSIHSVENTYRSPNALKNTQAINPLTNDSILDQTPISEARRKSFLKNKKPAKNNLDH